MARNLTWQRVAGAVPLAALSLVWLAGVALIIASASPGKVVVIHWANGHMVDQQPLLREFAAAFMQAKRHRPDSA